jgi:hypothetical protein
VRIWRDFCLSFTTARWVATRLADESCLRMAFREYRPTLRILAFTLPEQE